MIEIISYFNMLRELMIDWFFYNQSDPPIEIPACNG